MALQSAQAMTRTHHPYSNLEKVHMRPNNISTISPHRGTPNWFTSAIGQFYPLLVLTYIFKIQYISKRYILTYRHCMINGMNDKLRQEQLDLAAWSYLISAVLDPNKFIYRNSIIYVRAYILVSLRNPALYLIPIFKFWKLT